MSTAAGLVNCFVASSRPNLMSDDHYSMLPSSKPPAGIKVQQSGSILTHDTHTQPNRPTHKAIKRKCTSRYAAAMILRALSLFPLCPLHWISLIMPGAPIAIALPTKTNLYSDRALGEKHSKTQVPPGTHRYPPAAARWRRNSSRAGRRTPPRRIGRAGRSGLLFSGF